MEPWSAINLQGRRRSPWVFDQFFINTHPTVGVCKLILIALFHFHLILATWFHMVWALLASDLMAHISKATWNWFVQHWFAFWSCNIACFKCRNNKGVQQVFKKSNWLLCYLIYQVSLKNVQRLMWCKLKTTVFTPSAIFSESLYFKLKFDIKQSYIGWNLAEQWLTKADDRQPNFFRKMHWFKAAILL